MPQASSPVLSGAVLSVAILGAVFAQSRVPGIVNVVPDVARPLPLNAVRLTGGPLKRAQDLDATYLLELEPDRMLAFYRIRAGLEPKAPPYGGWDGDDRNLTGHIAGHHLSAISLMGQATGDVRFKQRADYMVNELKIVQDKNGDGYLSALARGREAFAELAKGTIRSASFDLNGLWSPWYTLHKTYAGLRDAYRYAGNRTALDVEVKFAQWAEGILSSLSDAQLQQMLNTEFGGMNEVLADLYADTGDRRWLALSHKFDHRAVLDPLVRGDDRLSGLHGNTQVPKVLGSAVRYAYTGDREDGAAARFFWDRVVGHHTFATGGHGKDEYFREPDPARPMTLVVTYNSDTRWTRTFAILVDDQRIGEQTIRESSESRFFDVEYPIPSELVRGKQKVRVRFQAAPGNETAPVFGVRIVRVDG